MAPMGGMVAVYPAPLLLAVTAVQELSQITITNPSGSHHEVVSLNTALGYKHGTLVAVGWADPEMLLCISSKGNCSVISPKGASLLLAVDLRRGRVSSTTSMYCSCAHCWHRHRHRYRHVFSADIVQLSAIGPQVCIQCCVLNA